MNKNARKPANGVRATPPDPDPSQQLSFFVEGDKAQVPSAKPGAHETRSAAQSSVVDELNAKLANLVFAPANGIKIVSTPSWVLTVWFYKQSSRNCARPWSVSVSLQPATSNCSVDTVIGLRATLAANSTSTGRDGEIRHHTSLQLRFRRPVGASARGLETADYSLRFHTAEMVFDAFIRDELSLDPPADVAGRTQKLSRRKRGESQGGCI